MERETITPEVIKELKEKIEKIESQLQKETPETREREIKKEIRVSLEKLLTTPTPPKVSPKREEVEEIEKFSKPEQVGALISIALEKGVLVAVNFARSLKNPAILDEFHDTLVDIYYDLLVKKGKIKPV